MASEPEVSSAVGAAVVGLLGTLWSRVARGTAFTTQSAAILLLVPNGLAAAGGIVMSSSSGTQSFYEGAQVALRQIQTSVGESSLARQSSVLDAGLKTRRFVPTSRRYHRSLRRLSPHIPRKCKETRKHLILLDSRNPLYRSSTL